MGLIELMSSEAASPSGRPLRAAGPNGGKSLVSAGSSAGQLDRAAGDNDAYIAQIIMKDQDRQQKQSASEMRRLGVELREVSPPSSCPPARRVAAPAVELRGCLPGWNVVQMWLAKVRQQEYDKKEARLGVIDKRLRSETGVRVREREYRKARCAAATPPRASARVDRQRAAGAN